MAAFVQYVRVDHGGADVLVTEQFLDCPDVVTGLKEVRGERMPECVATHVLHNPRLADGLLDCSLQNRLVNVMPSFFARLRVVPPGFLRKDPLPAPVFRRVGVLPIEDVWELHDQLSILPRSDPNRS